MRRFRRSDGKLANVVLEAYVLQGGQLCRDLGLAGPLLDHGHYLKSAWCPVAVIDVIDAILQEILQHVGGGRG